MGLAAGGDSGPRREAAEGRGACPPSSPPAPPLLPLPSSALGSRACRGTLPPQARRLTHLPGPGTCSPGNAREFSEDSISQGLREPQNSLDSAPGKARERLGGWNTLGAPCLCLSYMLTSCGPQPTAVPSFIVRQEKAWGSWGQRRNPPGDTCPLESCLMSSPWSREKPSFYPLESSVCPRRKYHLPWLSVVLCQEVLPPV